MNLRPNAYEALALPLSYPGAFYSLILLFEYALLPLPARNTSRSDADAAPLSPDKSKIKDFVIYRGSSILTNQNRDYPGQKREPRPGIGHKFLSRFAPKNFRPCLGCLASLDMPAAFDPGRRRSSSPASCLRALKHLSQDRGSNPGPRHYQ